MFFSLGEWLGTKLFGRSDWVLRLGAVIPALGAIGLLAVWTKRRYGKEVALVVATLMVTSPVHLLYSTQARGYGLGILVAAMLLVAGVAVAETGQRRAWIWLGVAAAIGIWTLPHLAFLYGGHLLSLVRRPDRRRGVFVNGLVVSVASLVVLSRLVGRGHRANHRSGSAPVG